MMTTVARYQIRASKVDGEWFFSVVDTMQHGSNGKPRVLSISSMYGAISHVGILNRRSRPLPAPRPVISLLVDDLIQAVRDYDNFHVPYSGEDDFSRRLAAACEAIEQHKFAT